MIGCVSPSAADLQSTINTLRYAESLSPHPKAAKAAKADKADKAASDRKAAEEAKAATASSKSSPRSPSSPAAASSPKAPGLAHDTFDEASSGPQITGSRSPIKEDKDASDKDMLTSKLRAQIQFRKNLHLDDNAEVGSSMDSGAGTSMDSGFSTNSASSMDSTSSFDTLLPRLVALRRGSARDEGFHDNKARCRKLFIVTAAL